MICGRSNKQEEKYIMVYTKQEKQEIERVLAVFAKYLNQRNHCDIAWSNKLGYLLLDYHTYVDDVTPIGSAADLCREMLDYMMIDSVTKSKSGHLLKEIDAVEKAEIQRLWQPYFEQLPEYEYLREELTSAWP